MNELASASYIGRSITRREDRRLLTGRGQFIADFELPQFGSDQGIAEVAGAQPNRRE